VLYGDLQCLHYSLVDMHKLSPQFNEVMEFQIRLNVKQIVENLWKLGCITLFGPLNQILPDLNNFVDLHTCRTSHQDNFSFGSVV
jgi:hypothetical protein